MGFCFRTPIPLLHFHPISVMRLLGYLLCMLTLHRVKIMGIFPTTQDGELVLYAAYRCRCHKKFLMKKRHLGIAAGERDEAEPISVH